METTAARNALVHIGIDLYKRSCELKTQQEIRDTYIFILTANIALAQRKNSIASIPDPPRVRLQLHLLIYVLDNE